MLQVSLREGGRFVCIALGVGNLWHDAYGVNERNKQYLGYRLADAVQSISSNEHFENTTQTKWRVLDSSCASWEVIVRFIRMVCCLIVPSSPLIVTVKRDLFFSSTSNSQADY